MSMILVSELNGVTMAAQHCKCRTHPAAHLHMAKMGRFIAICEYFLKDKDWRYRSVQHLPSLLEALGSISSVEKKGAREGEKEGGRE